MLLDTDLAILYGIETKQLKRQVRRNILPFPEDFMLELNEAESESLRRQIGTSNTGRGGQRYQSFAFTEQGVAMLSGILNSPRAIEANIAIMRTFVALRKWMQSNKELSEKIRKLESKYDEQFKVVFEAIRQLIRDERETRPIGFQLPSKKGL